MAVSATYPKKVAVTGGSGFLGINLIRHLLAAGCEVVSIDRAPFDYPEKQLITPIDGDIRDEATLLRAFDGVDAVVHAAAALPLYPKAEIFSVDVDGTRNVAACAAQSGVSRFVHISSTAVYGVPDHHPLFEDDPLVGVGPYGQAKIDAEAALEPFRDQMVVSVIRPKSFIGPERLGVFALLYDWASTGHNFPIPGKGSNRYQYLDVEDLCDAIGLCLTGPKEAVHDTFNIGAADFGTFKGDFQAVLDHAGFGKKVISLPAMPAIWVLRLLDKATKNLGFRPKYSNTDALIRNYDWYVANRANFDGQSGVSHRVPWKQGALALGKRFFR